MPAIGIPSYFFFECKGKLRVKRMIELYIFTLVWFRIYNILVIMHNADMKTECAESDNSESQVITYTAPWNIFALGFSNKPQYPFRLGIGSFLP